jgi:curved DNA-binding protein CbpA
MKDPYETLGVNRSATDKEIKDAFKKLARKFHPDLHPGDQAEGKFKHISAAKDFLDDKEKRRRFDVGEIDASGAERPQERFYRDFADGPAYASHERRMALPTTRNWRNFRRVRLRAVVE